MQIKNYFLLALILLVSGCAGPRLTVISPEGAPMPDPHYVATSTSTTQIRATYYYVGLVEVKDVDYSSQYTPIYLDRNIKNIKSKDFKELQLILQVYNPTETIYIVKTHQQIKPTNFKNNVELTDGMVAVSKLKYRQYLFQLPISSEQRGLTISYNVELINENGKESFMRIGTFAYQLN